MSLAENNVFYRREPQSVAQSSTKKFSNYWLRGSLPILSVLCV